MNKIGVPQLSEDLRENPGSTDRNHRLLYVNDDFGGAENPDSFSDTICFAHFCAEDLLENPNFNGLKADFPHYIEIIILLFDLRRESV